VSSQGTASLDPTRDCCVENEEILDDDFICCVLPEVDLSPEIEKRWWQLEEVSNIKGDLFLTSCTFIVPILDQLFITLSRLCQKEQRWTIEFRLL